MSRFEKIVGASTDWYLRHCMETWFIVVSFLVLILVGSTGYLPAFGIMITYSFFWGHMAAYAEHEKAKEKNNDTSL